MANEASPLVASIDTLCVRSGLRQAQPSGFDGHSLSLPKGSTTRLPQNGCRVIISRRGRRVIA